MRPAIALVLALAAGCGSGSSLQDREARIAPERARVAALPPPANAHATRVRRSSMDRRGDVHVVLDSFRNGRRIFGGEVLHHAFAGGGGSSRAFGDLDTARFDDTEPSIAAEQA